MSWWDTKGFTSFATKALKTAQQQIDKALDIREDATEGESGEASFSGGIGEDDFWGSYLGTDAASPSSKSTQQKTAPAKTKAEPTEDDLLASLSSPVEPSESASLLAQKAKSLQDKMKASSKRTVIDAIDQSIVKSEVKAGVSGSAELDTAAMKEDISSTKKGAPLKLGMKLGTKKKEQKEDIKKDDSIPGVSLSSAEIEEKLQREKEAEQQLLEMLGSGASASPKTPPPTVATLHLEDTEENVSHAVLENKPVLGQNSSNASLFDMSGSSIMQDSHCDWGDDTSLSILAESTMSISDVTKTSEEVAMEKDPGQENVGDTVFDISKSENGSEAVTVKPEIQPVCIENIISERDTTEPTDTSPQCTAKDESERTDIEVQEIKCDKTEDIPLAAEKESETSDALDTDVLNSECKTETDLGTNIISDNAAPSTVTADDIIDNSEHRNLTESSTCEKSVSFVMDDSQTSSSVDDLSSSNRTLTTEDLQALDNSQELPGSIETPNEETNTDNQSNVAMDDSEPADVAHCDKISDNESRPTTEAHESELTDENTSDSGEKTQNESASVTDNAPKSTEAPPPRQIIESPQAEQQLAMVGSHSSQLSSSSSFVKNMLEEAMVESIKDSESHCDSTSHSSSDMVRIESGQNSEQTSADELETATSSDIEIISHISTPTPNGGNTPMDARPFELSLRHGFSKSNRRNSPAGHRRTDSDSSGFSMQSKNGDEVVQESRSETQQCEQARRNTAAATQQSEQEETQSNPYETEKLLKKLADMAEILEAREKKLVELSRSNMDLTETNNILRNQLQQSEEAREAELTDLNQLTEEFTARISEAERKLNLATKERDSLKKHSQELEGLLTKRSDASSSAQKMLLEKDQQISELMEEGEKLSKQQLQSNNIIKKLRSKEKENETLIKSQKDTLDSQKAEMERLKKVLDNKCDVEKQQADSINQLQAAVQRYEKELDKLKSDLEDSSDKNRSLQAALDNSYKEIAELHKANVMKASQVQEEKLSSEMQAKQELQIQLDRQLIQAKQEQEALLNQIEDLRLSMTRLEKEGSRREDILRQEISDLQQRLQEAEDRNQELTQGVTAATRPLLRQIENLQSTYTAQSASYERVEKNLTERLNEAQLNLATAQEKERVASEQLMEVTTKLTTLETQLSSLRQDKSKLQAQLEMEKTKVEVLEDAKNNFAAQREALQHSYDQEISQLKKEKLLLENQCEMEKIRVEAERKKAANIADQLRDKEIQLSTLMNSRPSTPRDGLLRDSTESPLIASMSQSMSASFFSTTGEDTMDKSFVITPNGSKTSLYESLRNSGAATLMENLQSQVKQQDGEIVQLQNEIRELERTRESMAREMVNLSNKNEEQATKIEEYAELKKRYQELDQRYNALLQMYGEKVEEVQELRLDLSDVKDLYKSQIDELLSKR